MGVVPARVHHIHLAAEILALGPGRKGKAVRLLERQRVQFGSQTTGPGLPPLRIATTPVRAMPVLTSRPNPARCAAMRPAVLVSCSPSSPTPVRLRSRDGHGGCYVSNWWKQTCQPAPRSHYC